MAQQQQQQPSTNAGYDRLEAGVEIELQDVQSHKQESKPGTVNYSKLDQHDADLPPPPSPPTRPNKSLRSTHLLKGWRRVITISSCAILVIIVANIALLVWALQQPARDDIWAHLVINLMSTVILASSNYGMQVLAAPTRALVDLAHTNKKFLDIGISSTRNLIAVPCKQKLLWAFLLIGSLPLHLFWNSVIVFTDQATSYEAHLVTQDFARSFTPLGSSQYSLSENASQQIEYFRLNLDYERFSTADCISIVKPLLIRNAVNIVLVSNITSNATYGQILAHFDYQPVYSSSYSYEWQCDGGRGYTSRSGCLMSDRDPHNWTFPYIAKNGMEQTAKVEYCLVASIPDTCTVEILPFVQGIVLIFNVLKSVSLLAILLYIDSEPLLTLGDAIASFLDDPDPEPARIQTLVTAKVIKTSLQGSKSSKPVQYYFGGASGWRLGLSFFGILGYWVVGIILFALSRVSSPEVLPLSYALRSGITSIQPQSMWTSVPGTTIRAPQFFTSVLLSNTPQLILSVVYFSYNAIFTSIAMAREWVAYAQSRKGLRTHQPEGGQRPTHFLSLPYRYSLPIIVASGILHWLLSSSFFVVKMRQHNQIYGYFDDKDWTSEIVGVGWSSMALLLLLILGALMIIALLIAGFRRYPKTVPMVASNSLAISANCQPIKSRKREAIQKLQYGIVMEDDSYCYTFSSETVQTLVYDQESWPRKLWMKFKARMWKK